MSNNFNIDIFLDFMSSLHKFSSEEVDSVMSKLKKQLKTENMESRDLFGLKSKKIKSFLDKANIEHHNVIIEYVGEKGKLEIKEDGMLHYDRMLCKSPHKNIGYGFVPNTIAKDGDPVDVFILFPAVMQDFNIAPIEINVIPLMLLRTKDDNEQDNKVLAIPSATLGLFLSADKENITSEVIGALCLTYMMKFYGKDLIIESLEGHESANEEIKNSII